MTDDPHQKPDYLVWRAIHRNDLAALERLHGEHPQSMHEPYCGNPPIFVAIRHGAPEIVRFFLHKVKVSHEWRDDNSGHTPLMHACTEVVRDEIMEEFLAEDISSVVNNPVGNSQPVGQLLFNGRADLAARLVEKGADLTRIGVNGTTCMHRAAYGGLDCVRLVHDVAPHLLEQPDNFGKFPLDIMAEKHQFDCVRFVHEKGGNVDCRWEGTSTALMVLAAAKSEMDLRMMALLLELKADACATDAAQNTALHYAAMEHVLKPDNPRPQAVVQLLGDAGTPLNAVNNKGETALSIAVGRGDVPCVEAFLMAGMDPNIPDSSGRTPLMRVAADGGRNPATQLKIIDLLMNYKANPLLTDLSQRTAHSLADNLKAMDWIAGGIRSWTLREIAENIQAVTRVMNAGTGSDAPVRSKLTLRARGL